MESVAASAAEGCPIDMSSGSIRHQNDGELVGRKRRYSRMDGLMKKYLSEDAASPAQSRVVSQSGPVEDRACRPWNRSDFFHRLRSFENVYDWFAKPPYLSPVAAALHGWRCSGRDRLFCGVCEAAFVDDSSSPRPSAASDGAFLQTLHREGCPWRDNVCDETFRNIPPFDFDAAAFSRWSHVAKALFSAIAGADATVRVSFESETQEGDSDRLFVDCSAFSGVTWLPPGDVDAPFAEMPDLLRRAMQKLGVSADSHRWATVRPAAVAALVLSVSGWAGAESGDTTAGGRVDLCCDFCRRRSPLVVGKAFDPLRQHRSYCAWISPQHRDGAVGWRYLCEQLRLHLSAEDAASAETRDAAAASRPPPVDTAAAAVQPDPAQIFARVSHVLRSEL